MLMLVLFLAWLTLLGLDVLRPEYRGRARLCEKALKYLIARGDGLKDKDEEAEMELGENCNASKKESVPGEKDEENTEKGELIGEQLGLNEPRRRNGV
jgi:hypothetical protein